MAGFQQLSALRNLFSVRSKGFELAGFEKLLKKFKGFIKRQSQTNYEYLPDSLITQAYPTLLLIPNFYLISPAPFNMC
jgi:hypothetical protein